MTSKFESGENAKPELCSPTTHLLALPAPRCPAVSAGYLVAALVLDGGHAAAGALAAVAGQVLEAHRLRQQGAQRKKRGACSCQQATIGCM
jgi:hypothetical protein